MTANRQAGLSASAAPVAASGGEALLAMPGGGDVFYGLTADVLLAEARTQSELCLHHATKTRQDHLRDLESTAWLQILLLGVVPLWLTASAGVSEVLSWVAPGLIWNDSAGFLGLVFLVWALAAWGTQRALVYSADRRTDDWGWERRTVLNLVTRCCVGEHTTLGHYPRTTRHVWPMSDLAVCYRQKHDWEDGAITHDLLLVLQQPPRPGRADTIVCLHQGTGTWQDAHALGKTLARLWQLPFVVTP